MDLWLQYVIPANAIAARIVGIIIGLFALWVCLVAYRWRHTATLVEVLRRCSELNRLVEARHAFLEIRDSGNAAKAQSVADSLFDDFCRDVRLPANDVLTLHLRTIFDAGLHDSRLEVGQLLRHTSGRVLQPNSMLRSMLTTFVLLGLLGTLLDRKSVV